MRSLVIEKAGIEPAMGIKREYVEKPRSAGLPLRPKRAHVTCMMAGVWFKAAFYNMWSYLYQVILRVNKNLQRYSVPQMNLDIPIHGTESHSFAIEEFVGLVPLAVVHEGQLLT